MKLLFKMHNLLYKISSNEITAFYLKDTLDGTASIRLKIYYFDKNYENSMDSIIPYEQLTLSKE